MGVTSRIADTFRMTDDAWRRHANPWSVWTRFAAIPLMILAIWSRVWLGWWCLLPVAAVVVMALAEPAGLRARRHTEQLGGQGHLRREALAQGARTGATRSPQGAAPICVPIGAAGFVLLVYGLVRLEVWPTVFGASLIVLAQLWRIDRLVVFYESTR